MVFGVSDYSFWKTERMENVEAFDIGAMESRCGVALRMPWGYTGLHTVGQKEAKWKISSTFTATSVYLNVDELIGKMKLLYRTSWRKWESP